MSEQASQLAGRFLLVLIMCSLVPGCNSSAPSEVDDGTAQLSLFGQMYARYLAKHDGAPPADEKSLKKFLVAQKSRLNDYGVSSLDELFLSPRDKEPLVVMYGKGSLVEGPGGLPWVAYERTGMEGLRYVIGARGSTEAMTAEQIEQTFP